MGKAAGKNSALSRISYNDYMLLACHMDAEWSRRRQVPAGDSQESFLANHRQFATDCQMYRNKIAGNYHDFEAAHGREPVEPLAEFLFNPMCFVPFGHADDLFLVLLDDFDPVYFLASRGRTTTEEICLAFCPKAESYKPDHPDGVFCDPHTLLGPTPIPPRRDPNNPSHYWPASHRFQQEMPLLFFTKYKIHALGALGQGMLFMENLYKAMAAKIGETITTLRESAALGPLGDDLILEDEVAALRCVFLDLQGPEEIGTMMFCRNYSVAKAALLAVRSLTFRDVFDVNTDLTDLLMGCKSHRSVIGIQQPDCDRLPDLQKLRNLHVFRWTHSSLSVSPKAFFDPTHPHCGGYVGALLGFQVSPGHLERVEQITQTVLDQPHGGRPGKTLDARDYHLAQIGPEDMTIPYSADPVKRQLPVEPLSSVLEIVRRNLHMFGTQAPSKDTGRDVVDSRTTIMVPVPKKIQIAPGQYRHLSHERVEEGHFSPLVNILPVLQQRLCFCGEMSDTERQALGPHVGRLDLVKLRQIPLTLGIPVSLRRTIEDLYKHFAILLGDPFLFDTVLDLYDTFATLHAVLTKHLPRACARGQSDAENAGFVSLDEARVGQLALLVAAIQNGLVHRVLKMYAETPVRELPIDLRGGLNQILLAADAPVKCGLGLLRKYAMLVDEGEPKYDCVGGLTRIGVMPGAVCHSLSFGTEDVARLAVFEVDVPHVVHINTYCENLHEAFHLIFSALCHKKASNGGLFAIRDAVMADRVSEVFANLLTYLFIFDCDKDAFIYHQLCVFSQSLSSIGRDDCEVVMRFTELAMRLFAVVDATPDGAHQAPPLSQRAHADLPETLSRFESFIRQYGAFFGDYERLWTQRHTEEVWLFVRRQFREIYPRLQAFLPQVWAEAQGVYQSFLQKEGCCRRSEDSNEICRSEHMAECVRTAFAEARPLIRGLYQDPHCQSANTEDEHECMSPLTLICLMLGEYVQSIKSANGKAVHLCRRPDGSVVYSHDHPWHEFQVEKGATAMFCPVPTARRIRLKKEIVVLKTFWDISSTLRERRLWALLADNWQDIRKLTLKRTVPEYKGETEPREK